MSGYGQTSQSEKKLRQNVFKMELRVKQCGPEEEEDARSVNARYENVITAEISPRI